VAGRILLAHAAPGVQAVAVRIEALVDIRVPTHRRIRDVPEGVDELESALREAECDDHARREERETRHAATLRRDDLVERNGKPLDVRAERSVLDERRRERADALVDRPRARREARRADQVDGLRRRE